MGIKAKGFFGSAKGGFKLGKSKPKVQGRFIRKKLNSDKNVKFAKKFFKSDRRLQKRYIRRKTNLLKRKAAEKALEGGKAVKTKFKKSITSKGFNPIKFITMIFVGWIINVLPKIVSTLKAWMKKLKPVFDTLKSWVKGVVDFFKWIGGGINKFLGAITGDNATVDAEKKKLQDANKNLKGAFKKQKKGFDDLTNKAKGEEKNLKKDVKNVENQVNSKSESGDNDKVDPFVVLEDNKDLIPPGMGGVVESEVKNNPSNYNTKTKINAALSNVGVDSSKVKYRSSYSNQSSTVKGITGTIRLNQQSQSIAPSPKNGNANLKADSTTKNRIVAIDVPYTAPKNRGGQGGNSSSSITTKQSDPDSVNSSELLLTSIEK